MIPKTVKVGGIEYAVKLVPSPDKSTDLLGNINYGYAEIEIKADMPEDRITEIFVHELLHAIFYEAGYEDHDEEQINRVAKTLHQVLQDNELHFAKRKEVAAWEG